MSCLRPACRFIAAFLFGSALLIAQTVISGNYNGATITGDISIAASTTANFSGGTSFTGANATFGTSAGLYWTQVGTLAGKVITFGNNSWIYVNGVNNAVTLGATTTGTGDIRLYTDGSTGTSITNAGSLTHTTGTGHIYARSVTNSGTITANAGTLYLGTTSAGYDFGNSGTVVANGENTTIILQGTFANTGTLRAENSGRLQLQGTNTTANLGTVQLASGGRALLDGTLDNTSATLNAPTGGVFELYSGTISGGTIASGALVFTGSGGFLDGATLTGDLTLPASTGVRFTNGATFTGSALNLGSNTYLYWQQVGTLANKALTFGTNAYLYVTGVNNAVTFSATTTGTGDLRIYSDGNDGTAITNAGTLTHTGGTGHIYARTVTNSGTITANAGTLYLGSTSTNYNFGNSGTITADGANTTVLLQGNVTNTGTLRAQNSGRLQFQGTNTTANLGTVQLATGGRALIDGTLNNAGATLNAPSGGTFELYSGTIAGGTIASGALSFTSSGGFLDGTTLTGNLTLPSGTGVRLTGGANFTGSALDLGSSSYLYWQQVGTLASKAITLGSNAYIYVTGVNNSLTLDASTAATGDLRIYTDGNDGTAITNAGTLTHTGGSGHIYGRSVTNSGSITANAGTLYLGTTSTGYTTANSGTIIADGANTTVLLQGNVTNTGTLRAQNSGRLQFQGTNTTANLGTVQLATGGRALLDGTLNNGGTTLNAPSGGVFELYSGTIIGGTIASGALAFTGSGGFLDGATLNGDLTLPANTGVRLTDGATFTGPALNLGNSTYLYWEQAGTLANKSLTFGSNAYIYVTGVNNALTLASTTTGTGDLRIYTDGNNGTAITNAGTLTHTGGSGHIYGRSVTNSGTITVNAGTLYLGTSSTSYDFANSGTIVADGTNTSVILQGNLTNTGTLRAQNSGRLHFQSVTSSANLGNVQLASGGRALLDGTITNAASTLPAPTGGAFELYSGTINGGAVANGALSFTSSGGVLNGVTLNGNLALPASSHVYFDGSTTFTGSSGTFGDSSGIYWRQVGTLTAKNLTLGNGAYLYVTGSNNALTLDSATTLTGDVSIYSDLSNGTAITNQGTLTHTTGSGQIYAKSVSNSGTITASAGSLTLGTTNTGSTFANQPGATINVNGANVFLSAPTATQIQNQGTINVQSGTLYTSNDLTNASGGTIRGAGVINGNLTFAGGTLAPGNSIGTLTFQNGTFDVTGPGVFAVELSGATADRLVFQNPPSMINLGNGLLSLNLTLLGAPTDQTTYNLIQITSGGSGITGTFAGLPTSGSIFSANYNGVSYAFAINYQTNLVSMSFTVVPEPSTYVMIGLGAVMVFALRRRRR